MPERIQKTLASTGVGSRRQIERWIREKRITVDGRIASIGDQLSGSERVCLDGRRIEVSPGRNRRRHTVLAHYKASGVVTTRRDPEGRATVFETLPAVRLGRWVAVGRLDVSTSGLLLLTTDGELAHRLMHPRYEVEREYAARLSGAPSPAQMQQLLDGLVLDDGPAKLDSIRAKAGSGSNTWCHVVLREGRNREVRRLFEAVGLSISRLIRVRYGPVVLGKLRRGESRRLTTSERAALYRAARLANPDIEK